MGQLKKFTENIPNPVNNNTLKSAQFDGLEMFVSFLENPYVLQNGFECNNLNNNTGVANNFACDCNCAEF